MAEPDGKPFSVRLKHTTHRPLCVVAKYHHRSQASMIDWLVTEEHRRLVKAGELKEELAPRQETTR
jgi:hypothetical protein